MNEVVEKGAYAEDGEIWTLIDHGGGQTCNVRGVLKALNEAGYVIVPVEGAQAMWAKFETSGRPELIWKAMMDAALKERE